MMDHHLSAEDRAHAKAWLESIHRPAVSNALRDIYAQVRSEVARRGPACWASGRCCNFDAAGHRLYVTGLEAAASLVWSGDLGVRSLDGSPDTPSSHPVALLSLPQVHASARRGDCPFLHGNACGIHEHKPLACRTYFCDRGAADWQQQLTEHGIARIRALHEREALAYRYAEWRWMLELLVRARDPD